MQFKKNFVLFVLAAVMTCANAIPVRSIALPSVIVSLIYPHW